MVLTVALTVVVASLLGASLYVVLEPGAGTKSASNSATDVLPPSWTLPPGCSWANCRLGADGQDLYQIAPVGLSESDFQITAHNWTTGTLAWEFNLSLEGATLPAFSLIAGGGSVLIIASASGAWNSTGQPLVTLSYCTLIALELSAMSGAFIGEQHLGDLGGCPFDVSTAQDRGWVTAVSAESVGSNLTVATFPEAAHGSSYSEWNETVEVGPLPDWSASWVTPVSMAEGTITVSVMGPGNFTSVLSGTTGSTIWHGSLPGWQSFLIMGYSGFSAPANLVRDGSALYYISSAHIGWPTYDLRLSVYNLTTRVASVVADLGNQSPGWVQLTALPTNQVVVTSAWGNEYLTFSPSGVLLWSRSLALTQVRTEAGYGQVSGMILTPISIGNGSVFLSMLQNGAEGADNSSFEYSSPIEIVQAATGNTVWSSSYTAEYSMAYPSPAAENLEPILSLTTHLVYALSSGGPLLVATLP